jgi:hypothetical protein
VPDEEAKAADDAFGARENTPTPNVFEEDAEGVVKIGVPVPTVDVVAVLCLRLEERVELKIVERNDAGAIVWFESGFKSERNGEGAMVLPALKFGVLLLEADDGNVGHIIMRDGMIDGGGVDGGMYDGGRLDGKTIDGGMETGGMLGGGGRALVHFWNAMSRPFISALVNFETSTPKSAQEPAPSTIPRTDMFLRSVNAAASSSPSGFALPGTGKRAQVYLIGTHAGSLSGGQVAKQPTIFCGPSLVFLPSAVELDFAAIQTYQDDKTTTKQENLSSHRN